MITRTIIDHNKMHEMKFDRKKNNKTKRVKFNEGGGAQQEGKLEEL